MLRTAGDAGWTARPANASFRCLRHIGGTPCPGSPALRVHLVLFAGHILSAGASTGGSIVIDNTARGIDRGDAGLRGKAGHCRFPPVRVPQAAAFAPEKCPHLELTPGLHRYPVDITASYQGCSGPGGSGGGLPPCLRAPENGPPPLPVGRYQAVMATESSIPPAKPVPVTVIHPRANRTAYRTAKWATMLTLPALKALEKGAAAEARGNGDASVHRGYIILTGTAEQAAAPDIVNGDEPVRRMVCSRAASPAAAVRYHRGRKSRPDRCSRHPWTAKPSRA